MYRETAAAACMCRAGALPPAAVADIYLGIIARRLAGAGAGAPRGGGLPRGGGEGRAGAGTQARSDVHRVVIVFFFLSLSRLFALSNLWMVRYWIVFEGSFFSSVFIAHVFRNSGALADSVLARNAPCPRVPPPHVLPTYWRYEYITILIYLRCVCRISNSIFNIQNLFY